jgi:hypothetical protein
MSKKTQTIQQILDFQDVSPKLKADALMDLAKAAIAEAEVLAETHRFDLRFSLTYGMGGTFTEDWDASSDEENPAPYAWMASSQSC